MIAVLMGVTGTGKSTVAEALVARTGWKFAEGDAYHSKENVAKMHAGHPLTDADRQGWLEALNGVMAGWVRAGASGVLTCSALKQSYRDTLVAGLPEGVVRFVLLEAPEKALHDRLERRKGHFMNPALLESQLAILEVPKDGLRVQATEAPEQAADEIVRKLGVTTG